MTLFRLELRRLATHPLPWLSAIAAPALQLNDVHDRAPDLTVESVQLAGYGLLIAACVLFVTNAAAARDRRHGTTEAFDALPCRPEARTRAVALAGMVVGALLAAAACGVYLAVRRVQGNVAGRLDPFEPLALVAATALAAVLGVVLARWLPSLIATPIVVVVLALATLLNRNRPELGFGGFGAWFLPIVLRQRPDWPSRPSALHLVYLVAAVVACCALALLRHGRRPGRLAVLGVALAVAVPAGAVATARAEDPSTIPPGRSPRPGVAAVDHRVRAHWFGPDAQRCEVRDGVTYCAFRDYTAWIPLWAGAVGPVAAGLPAAARGRLPVVRQVTGTWSWFVDRPPHSVETGLIWVRSPAYRIMLAGGFAAEATGLGPEGCDARGRAGTVVALWLLGRAGYPIEPEPVRMDLIREWTVGRSNPLGRDYGQAEVTYARRLLADPGARERIGAHWDTLVKSPLADALPLLGLTADTPIPAAGEQPCA
ncbi:hypothetical protein [Embleya sp. MST-111070]|uniref:hypothetical protein n=1 Tax=Embleya sp. MST-111070 TaxID=3398231 RepID=UPI003F736C43